MFFCCCSAFVVMWFRYSFAVWFFLFIPFHSVSFKVNLVRIFWVQRTQTERNQSNLKCKSGTIITEHRTRRRKKKSNQNSTDTGWKCSTIKMNVNLGLPYNALTRLFMLLPKWIPNICLRTSMSATTAQTTHISKNTTFAVRQRFWFYAIYCNIPCHLNATNIHTHKHMQSNSICSSLLNAWLKFLVVSFIVFHSKFEIAVLNAVRSLFFHHQNWKSLAFVWSWAFQLFSGFQFIHDRKLFLNMRKTVEIS